MNDEVLVITCCADIHELYSLIIDLRLEIVCREELVMMATTTFT